MYDILDHVFFRHERTINPEVLLLDALSAFLAGLDESLLVHSREWRLTLAGCWASIKVFLEDTMLVSHVHELLVSTTILPQLLYFITAPINSVPPQLNNGCRN